jgi:hypothetical protein
VPVEADPRRERRAVGRLCVIPQRVTRIRIHERVVGDAEYQHLARRHVDVRQALADDRRQVLEVVPDLVR